MRIKLSILMFVFYFSSFAQNTTIMDSLSLQLKNIKANCKADSNNKQILNLLNDFYTELMQADNGNLSDKTISAYQNFQNDQTIPNWQIFYLFNNYQNHITESLNSNTGTNPNFQISAIRLLSGEILETYGTIPPLILIYMGEALMSGGRNDTAKKHFEMALQFYPESVPLKVYNYILTDDKIEKNRLYTELKKNNSKHWMVIEKLP